MRISAKQVHSKVVGQLKQEGTKEKQWHLRASKSSILKKSTLFVRFFGELAGFTEEVDEFVT
jgi:hypothetical protein